MGLGNIVDGIINRFNQSRILDPFIATKKEDEQDFLLKQQQLAGNERRKDQLVKGGIILGIIGISAYAAVRVK